MADKITVEWLKKSQTLRQAYSAGLEFSFLSQDNRQSTPLAYCKDYLQDALMSIHHASKVGPIFGFNYDPSQDAPVCLTQTKLVICNSSDKSFSQKIPAMLEFMNAIEKKMKLIRTVACEIENVPNKKYQSCYALTGSSRWQLSPPMISLYTLLIRSGFCHKIGESYETTINNVVNGVCSYQSSDKYLLNSALPALNKIIQYGYAKIFHKEPKKNFPLIDINKMHNNFGIIGYANNSTVEMTYWHRQLKLKKKKVKKEKPVEEKLPDPQNV